jgi:prepilin peptidase CpaA
MQPAIPAASIAAALLIVAAAHDLAVRTIPNSIQVAVAVMGLALRALSGQVFFAIVASSIVFFVAALMWRRGWMGGGDVKLLGAAALVVAPWQVPSMLVLTSLAGGILTIPFLIMRQRTPSHINQADGRPQGIMARILRVERRRLYRGGPLPYAVAIATGAVFAMLQGV